MRSLALTLVVLTAMPAAADAWNQRLDAYRQAAFAERKKLGLDRDAKALFKKYPTPEVTFGEGGGAGVTVVLCPGETKDVTVSGKLLPGSLVGVRSDAVEIVKEALTPKGWQATVRVKKDALPGPVGLEVVAPVSLASSGANGLYVGCEHTWTLEVGGDTLVVKTRFQREEEVQVPGEWKRGGKVLGTMQYRVSPRTGSLRLDQVQTQDDAMAQMKAMQEMVQSPEMKSIDTRSQASMKKLEGCGKLPPEKMAACFAGPQKELDQLAKERDALMAKAEQKAGPAFGCRRLDVTAKAGTLSGEAEGCSGKRTDERLPVTGRYTAP